MRDYAETSWRYGEGCVLKKLLIALSQNARAASSISAWPGVKRLVRRFVAGERLEQAIEAVRALNRRGILTTLDYLGEATQRPEDARRAGDEYVRALGAIRDAGVRSTVSLKPTQLGLAIDAGLCGDNVERVLEQAKAYGNAVCIDMESSNYTQATLDLFEALRARHDNVSTVIQANLRRSAADLERLIASGTSVRLVKGAYLENASVAFARKREVDEAFTRLCRRLLSSEARDRGAFVAIASHDEQLLRWACQHIGTHHVPPSHYEFQLLYGVRQDLQYKLAGAGHPVRVYVSYGTAWYPYFMRRLAERPANVLFLLKHVFRA